MQTRELDSPPGLAPLYVKAVAASVLPHGNELPDVELVLEDIEIDRDAVAAYNRVCGFHLADALPPTYPHVLAFPLHMALMTERSFPFPLLGLVHIANRIDQRRALTADDRPTLRVRAQGLRDHPRGRQFDLVADAEVGGEVVWSDRSTYLRRGGGSGERQREQPPVPAADAAATWSIPGDIGRRYAEVSGDRNPIHLHPLSARLFGFSRAIAHGMWMKARCLAALEGRLPAASTYEVEFKTPLLIPTTARFASRAREDGFGFALFADEDDKPHLFGQAKKRP